MEKTKTLTVLNSLREYEALRRSEANERHDNWREKESYNGTSWYGVPTLEECNAIIQAGYWPKGEAQIESSIKALRSTAKEATSIKRVTVRGDYGDSYDIHAAMRGEHGRAWSRRAKASRQATTRQVTIQFPLICTGGTDSSKMFWQGAAAIMLSDILQSAGYQVEIIGTHGTRAESGNEFYHAVTVKSFDAQLDIPALTVIMCLSGYSRTVGFEAIVSAPDTIMGGLGTAIYDTKYPFEQQGREGVIGGLYADVSNKKTAEQWIKAAIEKIEGQDLQLAA